MSFSSQIKEELAETAGSARHCQIAEIAALLSMGGQVAGVDKGHPKVIFRTENLLVARKYFTLLRKTFNINTEISVRRNLFLQKKWKLHSSCVKTGGCGETDQCGAHETAGRIRPVDIRQPDPAE